MTRGITCCKDCVEPKRHVGCHSDCPEYLAEYAANEAEKEAKRKARLGDVEADKFQAESALDRKLEFLRHRRHMRGFKED